MIQVAVTLGVTLGALALCCAPVLFDAWQKWRAPPRALAGCGCKVCKRAHYFHTRTIPRPPEGA